MQGNELIGALPPTLYDLTSLETLDLGSNKFSSSITERIGEMTSLVNIRLWFNEFTSNIPGTIVNIESLAELRLAYNFFTGNVPNEICALFEKDLNILAADCGGDPKRNECSCCTTCLAGYNT